MYQIGDQVVYGIHGVCRVEALEQRIVDRKSVIYLVLSPIGQEGARFLVPTHNATAMAKVKHLLSQQEILQLVEAAADCSGAWISDENLRKQTYRELISSGDRGRLLQMVCTLYRHKCTQDRSGRKIHICDDNFLRDSEKLLAGEIGIVMGITTDEARQFLHNKLKEDA